MTERNIVTLNSRRNGITLHPKYGVNATISVCFLCGNSKDEILLLGAAYKGQAPMHLCVDKSPCKQCKEYMEKGILLICVQNGTDKENSYRTGHICVIKEEAAKQIFPNLGTSRAAFIEEEAWDKIGLPKGEKNEE